MKNILITGGAGFIGSRLSLELLNQGHNVRVLDCLSQQIHGYPAENSRLLALIKGKVDFIFGSVTNQKDLERALYGIDTIVHFAAETGTGQSMYDIKHYADVNIGGTALLLDLIANKNLPIEKIIVASSRAIYGEGKYLCSEHGVVFPHPRAIDDMSKGDFSVHCPICDSIATVSATDEETPVQPCSMYGVSKLTQEQMVLTVAKSLGISSIAFRYQNVFGPGQSLTNPYTGILSIFSTRIRNGKDINIFEDGLESRDFVYIDDVVTATLLGIEYTENITQSFNVGSGVPTNVLKIAESLQQHLGVSVSTNVSGQFRIGDIRHNYADITKIKNVLGFEPKVTIEAGLKEFSDWVMTEEVQVDRYDQSMKELTDRGLFK